MADDKQTAGTRAKVAAKKTSRGIWITLTWLIPVAIVAVAAWALLSGRGPGAAPNLRSSPEDTVRSYTNRVQRFVPPSNISPTQVDVEEWLEFFDSASRSWFEENVKALSWIPNQNDPQAWKDFTPARHDAEAMKYLLRHGALRGAGMVQSKRILEDGINAEVMVLTGSSTNRVLLRQQGDEWLVTNWMGAEEQIEGQVAGATPPK
ncbi:MAG: hypothetical protein RLY93_03290 [Sumerlaeia bacterium]